MSYTTRQLCGLAVVSGVMLLVGLAGFPSFATAGDHQADRCSHRVVRDYERPLRKMRPPQWPLKSFESQEEALPFGPSGLTLLSVDATRIVMQGNRFGYRIAAARATNRSGLLKQSLHLHWIIETKIWAVRHSGLPAHLVARAARYVGDVRNLKRLEFARSVRSGFYRYDIVVRNRRGTVLGAYGAYYRVVPRRVLVRIGINKSVARTGETVVGSFENVGTDSVLLPNGPGLDIEYEGVMGEWTPAPVAPPPPGVVVLADPSFVRGGYSPGCTSFDIPTDAAPGRYRFSVVAKPFGAGRLRRPVVRTFMVE